MQSLIGNMNESCKKNLIQLRRNWEKYLGEEKTSDTRDSFFCGHYGSISEADPAHVMWESQLQITAETYHKACGSSQPIQTLSPNPL